MNKQKEVIEASQVFPVSYGTVILVRHNKGLLKGFLGGFGGKVRETESKIDGAVRELKEEWPRCKFAEEDLKLMAVITFHWHGVVEIPGLNRPGSKSIRVYNYLLNNYTEGRQSKVGDIGYYCISQPPLGDMMPGDVLWLPAMLLGHQQIGEVSYYHDNNETKVVDFEIKKCEWR